MKRLISIGIVLIGITLLIAGIYIRSRTTPSSPTATSTDPFGFAGSQGTIAHGTPVSLKLKDGSAVSVRTFLPEEQPEWASSEYGYEVTPPDTGSYSILYYPDTTGFLISLLAEPIGQARAQAEQELRAKLQLTNSQFCQMNLQVFTSIEVNETYAGQDLGLSFCPGAVALPQ